VGVSAGLRNWALSTGVEVVFCSQRGRYLGQMVSGHVNRVERLRNQLAAADIPERFLPLARALVEAKIRKQAVLLRRMMRKDTADMLAESVEMMEGYADMLPQAKDREEIMGLEGAAARAYFQAWTVCVDPAFGFTGRNRRPPLDVVNSALSFGYAILLSEAVSALVATGLDPAIGFLHTEHDGRPSLALDLAEEFRPLVVDQVVLEALRRRRLRPAHGRRDEHRGGGAAHGCGAGGDGGWLRAADAADDPGCAAGVRRYAAPASVPAGSGVGGLGAAAGAGICGVVVALTVLVCYDILGCQQGQGRDSPAAGG
jgi:CRISP-associated protein Cas1